MGMRGWLGMWLIVWGGGSFEVRVGCVVTNFVFFFFLLLFLGSSMDRYTDCSSCLCSCVSTCICICDVNL